MIRTAVLIASNRDGSFATLVELTARATPGQFHRLIARTERDLVTRGLTVEIEMMPRRCQRRGGSTPTAQHAFV